MNSNFRKWYYNDDAFYETVMKKEEPPFEFKILLFLDDIKKPHEDEK